MNQQVTALSKKGSLLRSDWFAHRLALYRRIKAHVQSLLGPESAGLGRYRQESERDSNRKGWSASTRQELLQALHQAPVIWLADFHALEQSQKAQLRILKALTPGKPRLLGVECILAKHQRHLDAYLSGQLSEADFLSKVDWQHNWGFPWEHYRPILEWARHNRVRCLALNLKTKERTASTLRRRDRFAAELCAQALLENPSHQLLVIFGEWHLARSHLPAETLQLCKQKKIPLRASEMLTVWQNSEKIYFHLLRHNQDEKVDVVRWPGGQFALVSIPPWVQLQSYLVYLESQVDRTLQTHEADAVDWTDPVAQFYQVLCADLQISSSVEDLAVYTAADDLLFEKINSRGTRVEQKWYMDLVRASRSFHAPEWGLTFLAKPTINEAASLAMKVLHSKLSGQKRTWNHFPDDFRRQILAEALHYFGSKMINPKRKTDTMADLRASLVSLSNHRRRSSGRREVAREALQLALLQKMQERGRPQAPSAPRARISYFEAARILGGMMGEKLYGGFREGLLSRATMQKWLSQSLETEIFDSFYSEILEIVDTLPEPFRSKIERL